MTENLFILQQLFITDKYNASVIQLLRQKSFPELALLKAALFYDQTAFAPELWQRKSQCCCFIFQFDLLCSKAPIGTTVKVIFTIGLLVGAFVFGIIADR